MIKNFFKYIIILFITTPALAGVVNEDNLNINGLITLSAEPAANDYFAVYDSSAGTQKKVSFANVSSGITSGVTSGDGIDIVSNVVSADINATNLKFSGGEIDTIQNISTASTMQLTGMNLSGLTASTVLVSDGSKNITSLAAVSSTEAGYLDGVTSAIQTQINSKAATLGTLAQFAATTSAELSGVVSNETGSGPLVFGTSPIITTPEINYLDSTKTSGVASPYSILSSDSGARFNNSGATEQVYFTLTAAANLHYTFIVSDADGIRINMTAGDTLNVGTLAVSAGGFIQSTTLGSMLIIDCIDSAQCFAVSSGTWSNS